MKLITAFRIVLVVLTGCFMAYHTQIFISRIEPNLWFSWLASGLIEAFLISLAIAHTWVSRVLIVPLFLISVLSASASFVVSNEKLLDSFFVNKKVISQLQTDIIETQKEFGLGQKYTTKTLLRERVLKDELAQTLKGQTGDLTLINSILFLIFVFIMQLVSVYTAMHLKFLLKRQPEISVKRETETPKVSDVSVKVSETKATETLKRTETKSPETVQVFEMAEEILPEPDTEPEQKEEVITTKNTMKKDVMEPEPEKSDRQKVVNTLQKMKAEGQKLDQLAARFEVSKSTMSRVLNYPATSVSQEVFAKIEAKMRDSYPTPTD